MPEHLRLQRALDAATVYVSHADVLTDFVEIDMDGVPVYDASLPGGELVLATVPSAGAEAFGHLHRVLDADGEEHYAVVQDLPQNAPPP